jgi:adenylosuccinate synthase
MNSPLKQVDVCCGLAWGDEAKGKIVSELTGSGKYDMICRWGGGNNAGHTIYIKGIKYKTNLIPAGVFYNIPSIIGPDCVINQSGFTEEINYLKSHGFNTDCIKVSPKTHVITDKHIEEDKLHYGGQGTTSKGIAPCYRDKYARIGTLAKNVDFFKPFLWNERLYGTILCEGAQGMWLDINHGNYPYTTSSTPLPYGACSLGFPPQLIKNVFGAAKIYDTRVGTDPLFPDELRNDPELALIAKIGNEFGTTTGRGRTTNWLNLDKLISSINLTGTTVAIVSKIDVLQQANLYKLIYLNEIRKFNTIESMTDFVSKTLQSNCFLLTHVVFSDNPESVSIPNV